MYLLSDSTFSTILTTYFVLLIIIEGFISLTNHNYICEIEYIGPFERRREEKPTWVFLLYFTLPISTYFNCVCIAFHLFELCNLLPSCNFSYVCQRNVRFLFTRLIRNNTILFYIVQTEKYSPYEPHCFPSELKPQPFVL